MKDKDEEEIDLNDVIDGLKSHRKALVIGLAILISLTAFYVRTRDIPNLKGSYLIGLDPYVFYRYAYDLVGQGGSVPCNDTMRYYPRGFITKNELLMPTYAIAFIYKIVHPFMPDFTVMDSAIYYPALATALAMIFFFLLAKAIFKDDVIALSSSALLSVILGFIFRTSAGFADKEPVASLFIFALLFFFVKSLQERSVKKKIVYSLFASLFSLLSILSWGGANLIYVSMGFTLLLSFMLNNSKREDSIVYGLLTLSIALVVLFTGRFGTISSIFFNYKFVYFPLVLIMNLYKYELYPRIKDKVAKYNKWNLPEPVYIALSVIVLLFVLSLIYPGPSFYVNYFNYIIAKVRNPMGTDAFSKSVSENQAPFFYDSTSHVDWWGPLNYAFFTMLIGSAALFYNMFKKFKRSRFILTLFYVLTIVLFIFSRFSPDSKYAVWNSLFSAKIAGISIHYIILLAFILYLAYFFLKHMKNYKAFEDIKTEYIFLFVWFLITVIAARGAVRIIFAVCPPAMLMSGYFLKFLYRWLKGFSKSEVASVIIVVLIFSFIFVYNFNVSSTANRNFYSSFTSEWDDAMKWVRENTPEDSVFIHWWDYGYWVQTMGNRTTNLDGGNYYVNLDHMVGRYLFASEIYKDGAYNMTEPATVLERTFGKPSYLLIIDDDVLKYIQMGRIGKRPTFYIPGTYHTEVNNPGIGNVTEYPRIELYRSIYSAFPLQQPFIYNNFYFDKNSAIIYVIYLYNGTELSKQPYGLVYNDKYPNKQEIIPFKCYCEYEKGCFNISDTGIDACPLLMNDREQLVLITRNASDNLFTYLYLLNMSVPGFTLAYDNPRKLSVEGMLSQSITDIKIYRINYTVLDKYALPNALKDYWSDKRDAIW